MADVHQHWQHKRSELLFMSQLIKQKLDELATLRATLNMTRTIDAPVQRELLRSLQAELDALAAEYEPLYADIRRRELALNAALRQLTNRVAHTVDSLDLPETQPSS